MPGETKPGGAFEDGVPYSDHMLNEPAPRTADALPTMPPGPADAAALEHGRELASTGTDRSAAWWAAVERVARDTGIKL